jgi:hypothetical protein
VELVFTFLIQLLEGQILVMAVKAMSAAVLPQTVMVVQVSLFFAIQILTP